MKGTKDWTQVTMRFETGSAKSISINCLFGGWGTATGKAWWDDVSLRKVEYEIIASDEPEVAKGDVARGKKIFMTHPIAACTRCHVVNGVWRSDRSRFGHHRDAQARGLYLAKPRRSGRDDRGGLPGQGVADAADGCAVEAARVGRRDGLHPDPEVKHGDSRIRPRRVREGVGASDQ